MAPARNKYAPIDLDASEPPGQPEHSGGPPDEGAQKIRAALQSRNPQAAAAAWDGCAQKPPEGFSGEEMLSFSKQAAAAGMNDVAVHVLETLSALNDPLVPRAKVLLARLYADRFKDV